MYVYTCIYIYKYVYIQIYVYNIHTYICVYIYMFIYIYMYVIESLNTSWLSTLDFSEGVSGILLQQVQCLQDPARALYARIGSLCTQSSQQLARLIWKQFTG